MKKREDSYQLTFLGHLHAVALQGPLTPTGLRDALMSAFMQQGLGTDKGTCPAIVFGRDKKGHLGPGTLTEVRLK